MHDSFTPLGGLVPLWLIQLGEVIFGGVGSGLYGMLMFAIVAVFVAGLMVGRTPEYLGKKIEAYEMKMASLVILVPPRHGPRRHGDRRASPTAGQKGVAEPGRRTASARSSTRSPRRRTTTAARSPASRANTPFYNTALGVCDVLRRASGVRSRCSRIAGSLAQKKLVPPSAGTLPTHTPLFVALLVGVVILVGALTFIPALALGPDRRAPAQLHGPR